jgi:beta-glucanase (GH16 family)
MDKDWQRGSTFMNDDVKIEKELGVGADGYSTGGKTIEMTSGTESQVVTVRGTKRMRADKKPVKATWY